MAYDSIGNLTEMEARDLDNDALYELAIDFYEIADGIKNADYERMREISDLESKLSYGMIFNRRVKKKKEDILAGLKNWRNHI